MTWSNFILFALPTGMLWLSAAILIFIKQYRQWANTLTLLGIALFALYIIGFWIRIDRPPMQTMGETRLWYSMFISAVGYIAYRRWKYNWLLSFSNLMATLFVAINVLKPEIHSKNLMPALQSNWFIPHVTSYILSYAMFGAATIGAIVALVKRDSKRELLHFIDNMIYIGYGLLMMGLLMGAIWAKEAWGHYWSWDPKETWAAATAAAYITYIHIRLQPKRAHTNYCLWLVVVAFVLLMTTWIGVSYLPSAQSSIHVY